MASQERSCWTALRLYSVWMLIFLYLPIAVLVFFSFNRSWSAFVWGGFSLHWYAEIFRSPDVLEALKNSLTIAVTSSVLSIVLGICYIFFGSQLGWSKRLDVVFTSALAIPEIVLGVGLLTMFMFANVPLGILSVIVGHTAIGLGYAIPILSERFASLDKNYTQASFDLGATYTQTLRFVIMPLLQPALASIALLVFIISLDDFVVSFFLAGASVQTLPMYIFSMLRSGATPIVNALSTVLLVVTSIVVLIASSYRSITSGIFSR